MCGKLKAAVDARRSANTLILARTDALAVEGIDAASDRAEAYLACGVGAACQRFAHRIPLLAIFSGGTARAVAHTLQSYYASLHAHQTTAPFKDHMLVFDGLNALIGTPELMAQGRRYESI